LEIKLEFLFEIICGKFWCSECEGCYFILKIREFEGNGISTLETLKRNENL
jgi:hypothetical protein